VEGKKGKKKKKTQRENQTETNMGVTQYIVNEIANKVHKTNPW
jgi:hypothetical protein